MSSISLGRFFGAFTHLFGPSGAGKSVVAVELADRLKRDGYSVTYFSSGDGFRDLVKDPKHLKDPIVRKMESDMNAGIMLDDAQYAYMKERVFIPRLTEFIKQYIASGGKAQLITDGFLRNPGQDVELWKDIQAVATRLKQEQSELETNELLQALSDTRQNENERTAMMIEGSSKMLVDIDGMKAAHFIKLRELYQLDQAINELDDPSSSIKSTDREGIRAFLSSMRDRVVNDVLSRGKETDKTFNRETDISVLTRAGLGPILCQIDSKSDFNQDDKWGFTKAMNSLGFRHIPREDGMTHAARMKRVGAYGTVDLSEAGEGKSGAIWHKPGTIGECVRGWCGVNMELDTGRWGLNDPKKEGTYIIENRTDLILDSTGQIDRDTRPLLREQVSSVAENIIARHRALELNAEPQEGALTRAALK